MWRVTSIIVISLVVVLFVALNMHTAQVNFPFTNGFETRTVFLVIASFLLGYGTACLLAFTKQLKHRKGRSPRDD